ncbi:outer membrane lipoprotein chaperone LolA [Pseudoteredinibacter isoporae]|uniref:Outer-membrane lipoprotein carrier protein n=1 Tax=Pseudoteredinibacter isoporae TaxID=570281 RepID=A0A7X0MVC6_9GAMM|nr:outer membrane lipoprotein chaperone LolA [Pseudoteredinibacter isoporae]MBB6521596.1 outer membrane lipoprotein carrier protein [Pseudoteredinibacter isoporae]NHO87150.1 outer membrane lipoprotein chaperone LolA [Pseudoteredinibacter isoporae]NIB22974.1 outer membrane lipoprotein chaperone LolA [Pseudoteredinibacter isoporae]
MKKITTSIVVAFGVFLMSALSSAGESVTSSAASDLSKRLLAIDSLQGKFQQTLTADDGELLQESAGDFALNKQGQYRWETKEPFAQLLIGDRESLLLYDPDLEQLNRRKLSEAERQTPLFILSSQERALDENYDVEMIEKGFQLKPKDSSNSFSTMDLLFEANLPSEIIVLDSLGQKTHIRLIETQANQVLPPSMFSFEPPPGTDIVDEG